MSLPHPRFHNPCYPMIIGVSGVDVPHGGTAWIDVHTESLCQPTQTSILMLTIGYATEDGILPAAWASPASGRCTVSVEGEALPSQAYPPCSAHPAAARFFAMVPIGDLLHQEMSAKGRLTIRFTFVCEPPTYHSSHQTLHGMLCAMLVWCEPQSVSTVVQDSIKVARINANEEQRNSATGFHQFQLSTDALSQATQQRMACTIDDDEVSYIGSSSGQTDHHQGVSERVRVSFRCPITYGIMVAPGKGRYCTHAACFDIPVFIRHALSATNAWNCPLCNAEVRHTDLVLGSALEDAMMTYGVLVEEEGCDSCFLTLDARGRVVGWAPNEEATEMMRQREVEDEGNEDDDDYDRHRCHRAQRRR